jgi:hypothetical protein
VVVAAGAGDGEAEEGLGGDVDLVADDVVFAAVELVAEGEEAEGGETPAGFAGGLEAVAGELGDDEFIVGEIGVEGVDHPIAVGPGVGETVVLLARCVALGVGVTGDIEPVAGPVFTVLRGGEEALDDLGVGVGRGVVDEGLHVGGVRRETDEIEIDAADEGGFLGGRVGGHPVALEFREDEVVDGVFDPRGVLHGGHGGFLHGLEGPVVFADAGVGGVAALADVAAGIGGAAADPLGEIGDLGVGEFLALGGHLEILVLVADGLDEERLVGLAGDDGGAGVAAGEGGFAGVEEEAAFYFFVLTVALVTVLGEDGADFGFEEFEVGGGEAGVAIGRMAGGHVGGAGGRGEGDGKGDRGRKSKRKRKENERRANVLAGATRRGKDGGDHERRGLTTLPATSVRRKSRPLKR